MRCPADEWSARPAKSGRGAEFRIRLPARYRPASSPTLPSPLAHFAADAIQRHAAAVRRNAARCLATVRHEFTCLGFEPVTSPGFVGGGSRGNSAPGDRRTRYCYYLIGLAPRARCARLHSGTLNPQVRFLDFLPKKQKMCNWGRHGQHVGPSWQVVLSYMSATLQLHGVGGQGQARPVGHACVHVDVHVCACACA